MPPAALGAATDAPRAPPPGPAVGPPPSYPCGPSSAVEGIIWQNGRTTDDMRRVWAAGARGAAVNRCGLCTAPLYLSRGELICFGCRSHLPIRWRRKVTELWLSGMPAADIARVAGGTKSAVLSYRRRAMLPARGTPLVGLSDSERAERNRRAAIGRTLPVKRTKPPPAAKPVAAKRAVVLPAESGSATPGGAASVAENVGRPKGLPRHAPRAGFASCQYITGRRAFCDDPVAELSPYCAAHTRLCYQARAA